VIGLLVLAALVLAALLFVGYPLVREREPGDSVPTLSGEQREVIALHDRRDTAYAALRELELEHRTGKLDDRDYALAREALRGAAIETLRRLEQLEAAGAIDAAPRADAPAENRLDEAARER
jgi:hypothetical protein